MYPSSPSGFVTIDFETTGLVPERNDRAIEVAVVHSSPDGTITGEWDTLINPGRDLGREDIHHITARDILHAPTFPDIAGELIQLLSGRVLVAHNASFDVRFLEAELRRVGYSLSAPFTTVCTMRLARSYLGGGCSLAACCAAYGIDLDGAHRASVDALATAQLLASFIADSDPETWTELMASAVPLAPYAGPRATWMPREHAEPAAPGFLERLIDHVPDVATTDEQAEYLDLVERCLIDRYLSEHEKDALVQLADSRGISRPAASRLHHDYVEALAGVAWADGVVTDAERDDLRVVATLLDVPQDVVSAALSQPRTSASASPVSAHDFTLRPGDEVVLTGEMRRPRSDWEGDLRLHGLVPKAAVTKGVRIVVAADPDSLSGKARKARDYGIPIAGEDWLEGALTAMGEPAPARPAAVPVPTSAPAQTTTRPDEPATNAAIQRAVQITVSACARLLDRVLPPDEGEATWAQLARPDAESYPATAATVLAACASDELTHAIYADPEAAEMGRSSVQRLLNAYHAADGGTLSPDQAHHAVTSAQLLLGALGLDDVSTTLERLHHALPTDSWVTDTHTGDGPIQITILATPTVSYASANSRVPLLHGISVSNALDGELSALLTVEASTPTGPIAQPVSQPLTLHSGDNQIDVGRLGFQLDPDAMYAIDERRRGTMTVTVTPDQRDPIVLSTPLAVLAPRQWWSRGWDAAVELLAAFVMPNDPSLAPVVSRAAEILGQRTSSTALDGYQTGDRERIDHMVHAVFSALRECKIAYALPPASWADDGQKVRTPHDVIVGRLGTCLDTTVTLAAALEAIGIRSFPVLVEGHAFLGYWRDEKSFESAAEMDVNRVRAAISTGEVAFVETTLVCEQPDGAEPDWTRVQNTPIVQQFDAHPESGYFQGATDVYMARRSGIIPLPSITTDTAGNRQVVLYQAAAPTSPQVEQVVSAHQPRVIGNAPRRVTQWKNALLDLSLRNRLINLGKGTYDVRMAVPGESLARLEDLVNGGKPLTLSPADDLSGIHRVGGVAIAARLDADELAAALEKSILFTDLTSDRYLSRLRALAYRARTIVQETGANNLYLSFGTLVWDIDGREVHSPLVLVPVRLEATGRGKAYRIVLDDAEESTPNFCLLEKIRQVHGVSIPSLETPTADASGIDLNAAFTAARDAMTKVDPRYRVDPEVRLSILQFGKFRLWKDLDENWAAFAHNPLVNHLIETPTEEFIDPAPAPDGVDLDALNAQCPMPTDGSQLQAVADAVAGRTFVLEGPPGTGKSQTITNMLARLIADGKRVLFVAEKGEAIKVVQKRLDSVGVGAFCLNVHDKSMRPAAVRAQLLTALDRTVSVDQDAVQVARRGLVGSRRTLSRYAQNLHAQNGAGLSLYGAHLRELVSDPDLPAMPVSPDLPARIATDQLKHAEAALDDLPEAVGNLVLTPHSPWRWIDGATPSIRIEALIGASTEIDEAITRLDGNGLAAAARMAAEWDVVAGIFSAPAIGSAAVNQARTSSWQQTVESYVQAARALQAGAPLNLVTPAVLGIDLTGVNAAMQTAEASSFFGRKKRKTAAFAPLLGVLVPGAQIKVADYGAFTGGLATLAGRVEEFRTAANALPGVALSMDWNPLTPDGIAQLQNQLAWPGWLATASTGETPMPMAARAYIDRAAPPNATMAEAARSIAHGLRSAVDAGATETSLDAWLGGDGLVSRWTQARTARGTATIESSLRHWHRILACLDPLHDLGVLEGRRQVLDGLIAPDIAGYAFDQGVAEASVPERRTTTGLADFDATSHESSVGRFRRTLRDMRQLLTSVVPSEVLARRTFTAGSASGQIGALRRELERQRGGLTVRALMAKYSQVITHITPCMMMSPDSVARFLPPQAGLFDVIVFDEASQVRVADAIGAMGRAQSVIVVGDSEQMPPTSFAESSAIVADDESDDETEEVVVDQESILTECTQARVHRRMLTWHYRSQDEALIAFSNDAYYNGALASFPTPTFGTSDDGPGGHGISLRRVQDGAYTRAGSAGSSKLAQTNIPEAQEVVDEVVRRFTASMDASPSLGIVTFNMNQRKLIDTMLRDQGDQRILDSLESDDGIFVKNLENVQGDERDTIFFSVGRAPDARGIVPLNFGPLNLQGGHRRLNVAITRARRQVVMFCSFEPSQLRVEQTNSRGVKDLGRYLIEAQRGSHAAADNPLRAAVNDRHRDRIATQLEARGFVVRRDVGLSTFRVDLSVALADSPEHPVAAVLLDGLGWADRLTVADRDALPGDVLTGLMHWPVVARLWLPEWLADPERAVDRLAERIQKTDVGEREQVEPSEIDQDRSGDTRPATADDDRAPNVALHAPITRETLIAAAPSATSAPVLTSDEDMSVPMYGAAATAMPAVNTRRHPFAAWPEQLVGSIDDLDALPARSAAGRVIRVIQSVVDAEGPVDFGRLTKVVASAFGLTKVATKRADAIERLIPRELRPDPNERFAWPTGSSAATYETYRVPSPASHYVRAVDVIHWRELVNAMQDIATASMGIEQESLMRETLSAFGWKRLTEGTATTLNTAVERGIAAGLLTRRDAGLIDVPRV
ncbi:DUF4011 domain-containing protein [Microbacterium terrisoli]|uniref:DUF4011 domain-containing protein n=1 Tax=Microbacterium terrisoli TaxID=3242192 RepID=UPI00280439B7|nr:DUF4011 domain-containing protein [Microbacterium protaetiae]